MGEIPLCGVNLLYLLWYGTIIGMPCDLYIQGFQFIQAFCNLFNKGRSLGYQPGTERCRKEYPLWYDNLYGILTLNYIELVVHALGCQKVHKIIICIVQPPLGILSFLD